MSDLQFETVRRAIALHLEVAREQIAIHHRLEEDLGLDLLDLILIVLHIEELENEEFPLANLHELRTVRDLVTVVRRHDRPDRVVVDRERADETLPPPPRHGSGLRPAARPTDLGRTRPSRPGTRTG